MGIDGATTYCISVRKEVADAIVEFINAYKEVELATASAELEFLISDVLRNVLNIATREGIRGGGRQFLILIISLIRLIRSGENASTSASVTEDRDALQALLSSVHIQVGDLFNGEVGGYVDRGGNGSVNVALPCGLHVDALTIIKRLRRDKVVRQLGIVD